MCEDAGIHRPRGKQAVGCIAHQSGATSAVSNGGPLAGRQLHVGQQALGYRRDDMEVCIALHFPGFISTQMLHSNIQEHAQALLSFCSFISGSPTTSELDLPASDGSP